MKVPVALWHFRVINYNTVSYSKVPKCHWHFRGTFEMDMSICPYLYNPLSISHLARNGHLDMSISMSTSRRYKNLNKKDKKSIEQLEESS